jgi:DNA-binding CsgD family transcriptional regulator
MIQNISSTANVVVYYYIIKENLKMRQKNRLLYNHELKALSRAGDSTVKMERKPIIIALKKPSIIDHYECVTALPQCYVDISTTWNELMGKFNPDIEYIAFHVDTLADRNITVAEWDRMMRANIVMLQPLYSVDVRVVIRKTTPYSIVKQLQKSSIHGILLDYDEYPAPQVSHAIDQQLAKQEYWPIEIIEALPGHKTKDPTTPKTLTDKQSQVLVLLATKGLSNREIGTELDITENTVKNHIAAIMRLYGLHKRAQLITGFHNLVKTTSTDIVV